MERMIRFANAWDANNDQVYTCDEWKKFLTDIFNKADRNRDGFVDPQEFTAIQDATAQFKDAAFSYFDDNRDGRVSRAEFVDKPNPFFLQFDRNRDCKVTLEEIMASAASQVERPRPPESSGKLR
jgi:Ca2+-binding EF-hand superfamily protein